MDRPRTTCLQVAGDVGLVLLAGTLLLAGLIVFELTSTQRYPPPPPSAWTQAALIGGLLVLAGLGGLASVVLRGGQRGWKAARRLAGVLAVGAVFPALIGAGNAAYFGRGGIALTTLVAGAAFVAAGAILLRRT